ncbi:MAG: ATP-binding protein [Youngiibacter sp.]|nr:ATP-binding protein [Youngiibacter sp.]
MSYLQFSEIPRLYTALAEFAACAVFILVLRRRIRGLRFAVTIGAFAIIQFAIQYIAGLLPIAFWVPSMMVAVASMLAFIYVCSDVSLLDAGYSTSVAFIAAEFIAAFESQVYFYFVLLTKHDSMSASTIIMAAVYFILFALFYLFVKRQVPGSRRLDVNRKELGSVILITLASFIISNINFAFKDAEIFEAVGAGIFYIRTLVDFSGLTMIYAQQEQRKEMRMKFELEAINNVLYRQYEQYQSSKESTELINRKYHDLKHQIAIIRAETDVAKKESYLAEMDRAISMYESDIKTGNSVLDTVLTGKSIYCREKGINLTCVADGSLLNFMDVMDICTIFGNAFDNAIEGVEKLADKDKHLIRVAVFSKNDFLMVRFENYFEDSIDFEDGLPTTTKADSDYHGYGIKSIISTVNKYGGNVTINTSDNWFILRMLIPLPKGGGNTADVSGNY